MKIEKLFPAFKDYIWGGTKLKDKYSKKTELTPCAESWELSFHKDGVTKTSDGVKISEAFTKEMIGTNADSFSDFPLLIKLIDAKANLSVQVHPSDDYAQKNENSYGKTEMWYIVYADEGAGIYLGFSRDVTDEEFKAAIAENRLTDLLNFYPVKPGESYFIPSGTIHAIGKGCLICEIQQNSNITYRVYDYGRIDKFGKPRELHVERAIDVTTLNKHESESFLSEPFLGVSKYFTVKKISADDKIFVDAASFAALTSVKGEATVENVILSQGETLFIPAGYGTVNIKGDAQIIMTEIRKYYVGIDLGGTFIKGGIVNDKGEVVVKDKVPTESEKGSDGVSENIAALVASLLKKANMSSSDIVGIGMGVPGMIDGERGEVVYSNNLGWEHFFISDKVQKLTGIRVRIANDANVAALGETVFGCGKNYKNTVMLTLGTGVGGGIVIGGKLFEGN
ncbi:MAG: ROK family protein, partial [Clostridia bacterium]|nr:ROK family protein [Clostridia bacterium]